MQAASKLATQRLEQSPHHAQMQRLARILREQEYATAPPMVPRILERLYREPNIDYQQLSYVTTSVLRCDPPIKHAMELCRQLHFSALFELVRDKDFLAALNTELMHAVLTKTVVKDLKIECLLTALRSVCLSSVVDSAEFDHQDHFEFMIALAVQCFKNEYIYAMQVGDEGRLSRLKNDLALELATSNRGIQSPRLKMLLAAYGMYSPLWTMDSNHQILKLKSDDFGPSFQLLIDEQIRFPYEELAIKKGIPSLGTAENEVSRAVEKQYEESPYPRWFSFSSKEPKSFASAMAAKFPHLSNVTAAEGVTRILVAGCGTGRHAIAVAKKFMNSTVMAVDLSRASLAFGIRKARELGVNHINFCHADILRLGQLGTSFHLIEAVGVLHHIEEPARAWQILSELLVAGGFMRIGLYSKLGREALNPAKEFVRTKKVGTRSDELRAIRQEMIEEEESTRFNVALRTHDSFTLSEFRDLLFHEHEVQFTLPEIADLLEQLKLDFLGFEHIPPDLRKQFQDQFPHEQQSRDLILWDQFEREHSQMFQSMYRFWVRKPSQH
jgi:SAM-dependent methyltransferase